MSRGICHELMQGGDRSNPRSVMEILRWMHVSPKPVSVFAGWMPLFTKPESVFSKAERVGSKPESVSAGWMPVFSKSEQVSAGCVSVRVKRMSVFAGRARVGAERAWHFPGPRSVPAEAVSPVALIPSPPLVTKERGPGSRWHGMCRHFGMITNAPLSIGNRDLNLEGLVGINLRKDFAGLVYWTLKLSYQNGQVQIFDSVNDAPETELREAFNVLVDATKS